MPLTNLKLPKEKPHKSELAQPCCGEDRPSYPYGTRIHINDEIIDRFPGLADSSVKDAVLIVAVGKIVEVSSNESESGSNERVEIQLTDMQIKKPATDKETIMEEAFAKATANKK